MTPFQVELSDRERRQAVNSASRMFDTEAERNWTQEEQERLANYVLWAAQRFEVIERIVQGKELV